MANMKVHFLSNNVTDGVFHPADSVGEVPEDVAQRILFPENIAEPVEAWEAQKEADAKIEAAKRQAKDAVAKVKGATGKPAA